MAEVPAPAPTGGRRLPDRLRLAHRFDPALLRADLARVEAGSWIDHFVRSNYEGRWTVLPLRSPAGTEHAHPVLQITSHPDATGFVDTPLLEGCPYFRTVLATLGFPMAAVRLMRLDPGSVIKTHVDADLSFDQGWARLHVPVTTNPGVEFLVNGTAVTMKEGECWYLRLSDPHSVRNDGDTPRVHIVIDAPVSAGLTAALERALATD